MYISVVLRQQLREVDDHRCAYCQTKQANSGFPMVIDHIFPTSQGGETVFENLCFACHKCNEYKGATIRLVDPVTGEWVSLFHPRRDVWAEHFVWDNAGIHLTSETPTGRATIIALKMNNEVIIDARRRWVSAGWHPPK